MAIEPYPRPVQQEMKRLFAILILIVVPLVMIKAQFGVEQPFFGGPPTSGAASNTIELVGLEYWWVFSDMDTNNAVVTNWVDRIQGSKWTNGSAVKPINTSTGVWFSGTTWLTNLGATLNGGASNTHWIVANLKYVGAGEDRQLLFSLGSPVAGRLGIDKAGATGVRLGWGSGAFPAFPEPFMTNIWQDTALAFGPRYGGGAVYTNGYNTMGVTNTTMDVNNTLTWRWLGTNAAYDASIGQIGGLIAAVREIAIYTNNLTPVQIATNHYYATNLYNYTP